MDYNPQPFFAVPSGQEPSRGRLLLLSYDFPPARTAGALRWQKLAGYAAAHGWQLDVVTLHPTSLRSRDEARLTELPAGTRVYGVPNVRLLIDEVEQAIWNVYRGLRTRLSTRRAAPGGTGPVKGAAIPRAERPQSFSREEAASLRWELRDIVRAYYAWLLARREARWAASAGAVAEGILHAATHRVIVTCGPPHLVHSIGSRLARRSGLPHVMDMRDPWSQVERLPEVVASPVWMRLVKRHELCAVAGASLVVCNTEPARRSMQALYPEVAERCITVMNGFDDEPLPEQRDESRFLIAYAGTIYLDRDPRGLFRGAARMIQALGLSPNQIGIEMMGSVQSYNGRTIHDLARDAGISEFVRVHPAGSREAAMQFLAAASLLVSLPQDSDMAIPSKIFEYMRFDAWLLALAGPGGATEQLLRGSGADVVAPGDVDAIAAALHKRFADHKLRGRPRQPALIPECSRGEQARRLFSAIDRIANTSTKMSPVKHLARI